MKPKKVDDATHNFRKDWSNNYRPRRLEDVVGQPTTVNTLLAYFKEDAVPHGIILSSTIAGVGKNTIARAIAHRLLQIPYTEDIIGFETKYKEINSAQSGTAEEMRDLIANWASNPSIPAGIGNNNKRVLMLDEAHNLPTTAKQILLPTLENYPAHLWIILCTTSLTDLTKPTKKDNTLALVSRCKIFELQPVSDEDLENVLLNICDKQNFSCPDSTIKTIISKSQGSVRQAISLLEGIQFCTSMTDVQNILTLPSSDVETTVSELAFLLVFEGFPPQSRFNNTNKFKSINVNAKQDVIMQYVIPLIIQLKNQNISPESIRQQLLSWIDTYILGESKSSKDALESFAKGTASSFLTARYTRLTSLLVSLTQINFYNTNSYATLIATLIKHYS